MLSERPEYNEKIEAGFLMAPVVYLTLSTSPDLILAPYINIMRNLINIIGKYEWGIHRMLYSLFGHLFCNEDNHPIFTEKVCTFFANDVIGFSEGQLNQ